MTPLERIIREIIAAQGSISLAAYMELALQHPTYGYYRVREPVGRTGDFITAPEVSQMFGEMIGVWCAEAWRMLGKPDTFALVELGPGRGTMMRDILRATAHVAGFHDAKKLYLIDSDEALRGEQQATLGGYVPHYCADISELPPSPTLLVANEFFDALPVRQFEKTFQGWSERRVAVVEDALTLVLSPLDVVEANLIPAALREALPGTIVETSAQAQNLMRDVARHLVAYKGSMLLIDYGYVSPSGSATVQAVSQHAYADIFERPGEVDLTAHVDFTALSESAREVKAQVSDVIGQGEFLQNMGIDIRTENLKKHAAEPQSTDIDAALHRLTDSAQMGELFKVIEIKG